VLLKFARLARRFIFFVFFINGAGLKQVRNFLDSYKFQASQWVVPPSVVPVPKLDVSVTFEGCII